jgi:hypothetical protein
VRLADVWPRIAPVAGLTSAIAAPESVAARGPAAPVSLASARAERDGLIRARDASTSDAAYWGYVGQIAYWRAVVSLLEAVELVGPDNLPDVEPPDQDGVVMDNAARLQEWGDEVLARAREAAG